MKMPPSKTNMLKLCRRVSATARTIVNAIDYSGREYSDEHRQEQALRAIRNMQQARRDLDAIEPFLVAYAHSVGVELHQTDQVFMAGRTRG